MDHPDQNIQDEINKIKTILFEGNSNPSILVQLAGLQKEVATIKKSLEIDLEKSLDMKFKLNEEITQVKLNELKVKMLNMQQQMDEGFKMVNNQLEELKNEHKKHVGYDWKTKFTWIAFAGTVLAAIFSNWHEIFNAK